MNTPKISVLIPTYNRRNYIEQCIDSALNQTFQDYEIIISDNASTDGSADFVAEKYAAEISAGKIKLYLNEKNMGAAFNHNKLVHEATGKYFMFLHSDDIYLSHALQNMYEIAERFNADVVHETKFWTTPPDGIVNPNKLILFDYDRKQINDTEVMSDDPVLRFYTWYSDIGIDVQHNVFNRKFFLENDLRFENFTDFRLLALKWVMKAKVLVKTPTPFYVYRNSAEQDTNSEFPPERVAKLILDQMQMSRHLDEFFAGDDFFRDNKELQYIARSNLFSIIDSFWVVRNGVYRNGITPELNQAVEAAFRKYLGDDAPFPTFLFHWIHAALCGKPVNMITPSNNK